MWIKSSFVLFSLVSTLAVEVSAISRLGSDSGLLHKRHANLALRGENVAHNLIRRAGTPNPRKSCKSKNSTTTAKPTSTSASSSTKKSAATPKADLSNKNDNNDDNSGGNYISRPGSFTPNGIKAGIAGGDSYEWMKDYIGSWYDWTPNPKKSGRPIAIPMLWGGGTSGGQDSNRVAQFRTISTPKYVLGFEEPDCAAGGGSAGMSVGAGVSLWNELIAPMGRRGALLGSPSMCHQAAEQYSPWLQPFQNKISRDWDFTAVHINKNNMNGVREVIDHYWNTYKKPIWVTEFACVDDSNGFTPCTNQGEINGYINQIVPLFEADSRVHAYHYSDGMGLGNVWPSTRGGQLSESGRTYLNAIKKYAN